MATNQITPEVETLYRESLRLDDAFHAEVVKQFGKKNAGDMRYQSSKHNDATKAASKAFHVAANAYIDARKLAEVR